MFDVVTPQSFISTTDHYSHTGVQEVAANVIVRTSNWKSLIDELLRIRTLPGNWDGEGASAPDSTCVDSALVWLQKSSQVQGAVSPSSVTQGPAGEVYLIWQDPGAYLEVEIATPYEAEIMLKIAGQPTQHWIERSTILIVHQ